MCASCALASCLRAGSELQRNPRGPSTPSNLLLTWLLNGSEKCVPFSSFHSIPAPLAQPRKLLRCCKLQEASRVLEYQMRGKKTKNRRMEKRRDREKLASHQRDKCHARLKLFQKASCPSTATRPAANSRNSTVLFDGRMKSRKKHFKTFDF